MIEPIVFDTSVYIGALRKGDTSVLSLRNISDEDGNNTIWLSAVVLEELYAGASNNKTVKALVKLERNFSTMNRLLVPNQSDWSIAGQVLNRIGKKYGYEKIGKSRLTSDTVLAISVARKGFGLITKNVRDFKLISEFRKFHWNAN